MTKVWKSAAALGLALVVSQFATAATGAGNGNLLAFTSLRGGNASLYVAQGDGSGARRLTLAGVGAYQGDAAWAPNGTRLVFTCGNFELCVTSANGSGTARLTKSDWPDKWSYDFEPAWSPDGTRIVFSRKRGGQSSGLWLVGADGTGLRRLVDDPGNEGSPEWSPDGLRIAYTRDPGTGNDLYVVDADGRNVQRLTSGKAIETDPDWSPDGATIAYARGTAASLKSDVWLMRASGGGQRRLTAGGEPSWSPDGAFLFLSAQQGNDDELFRVRANGTGRTRLTNRAGGDYTPQLQPADLTVTLPEAPSTPLAALHPDARTVGTLLARYVYVIQDLGGLASTKRTSVVASARALARDAAAGRAALAASRPTSARGTRVKTEAIAGFTAAQAVARTRLELVRLAPQGTKAAKRIAAMSKAYRASREMMSRRLGNAFTTTGL
jgi:dipeptidyl aminopeptidase/acylaminoacyl peptidase